jgi:hypothetical protein
VKPCFKVERVADDEVLPSAASVAIDGSKFKAVNTRDKNFMRAKVERRRAQLESSRWHKFALVELPRAPVPEMGNQRYDGVHHRLDRLLVERRSPFCRHALMGYGNVAPALGDIDCGGGNWRIAAKASRVLSPVRANSRRRRVQCTGYPCKTSHPAGQSPHHGPSFWRGELQEGGMRSFSPEGPQPANQMQAMPSVWKWPDCFSSPRHIFWRLSVRSSAFMVPLRPT